MIERQHQRMTGGGNILSRVVVQDTLKVTCVDDDDLGIG